MLFLLVILSISFTDRSSGINEDILDDCIRMYYTLKVCLAGLLYIGAPMGYPMGFGL
jgi:hypothetical protein